MTPTQDVLRGWFAEGQSARPPARRGRFSIGQERTSPTRPHHGFYATGLTAAEPDILPVGNYGTGQKRRER